MSRGRNNHYTQEQCNRVAKLVKQGLARRVICERMGISEWACRYMLERAR